MAASDTVAKAAHDARIAARLGMTKEEFVELRDRESAEIIERLHGSCGADPALVGMVLGGVCLEFLQSLPDSHKEGVGAILILTVLREAAGHDRMMLIAEALTDKAQKAPRPYAAELRRMAKQIANVAKQLR